MRFDVEIFGDRQFSREIERVGDRADDLNPVFESIFDRITEINAEQFLSGGARSSGGWAPLKPETILQKAREGSSTPEAPLMRTHALFEAMSRHADSNQERIYNGDWAVFRVTGEPGRIGAIHQSGGGNLPQRKPFELTNRDRQDFVDEMERFITTGEVGRFLDI